jgi:uracil-DNA glycosylase family 4
MSSRILELHSQVSLCSACFGKDAIVVPKFGPIPVSPPQVLILGEQPDREACLASGQNDLDNVGDPSIERLRMFMEKASLDPADVYYTTSVLCFPQDAARRPNRPAVREVKACTVYIQFLLAQLTPKLIIPLGHTAIQSIQWIYKDWRDLRQFILNYDIGNVLERKGISVYPLYHPSTFTLKSRPENRQIRDWQRIPVLLKSMGAKASR